MKFNEYKERVISILDNTEGDPYLGINAVALFDAMVEYLPKTDDAYTFTKSFYEEFKAILTSFKENGDANGIFNKIYNSLPDGMARKNFNMFLAVPNKTQQSIVNTVYNQVFNDYVQFKREEMNLNYDTVVS